MSEREEREEREGEGEKERERENQMGKHTRRGVCVFWLTRYYNYTGLTNKYNRNRVRRH